jgi:hypothetical protein
MAIEPNEIAHTEPVLSFDVINSCGKISFEIIISCKVKDFEDGNAISAHQ